VDDDCSYSCSAMAAAFKLYSDSNTPETEMVGFAPRKVHPDGGYWQAEAFHMLVYNTLFVTKGAFLHKRWFEIYWRDEHAEMRWLVDKNITAEDLLFSSIFAKEARKSPTAMQIKYKDRFTYGCGDGSSLAYAKGVLSPNQRRKLLVNYFFADLGHCPKLHCKCDRTLGDSSSYCLCNDVDKPTVIYDKHTPVTRCGYPFGFADNTLAFNVTSNQMEKLTKNADFI